MPVPIIFTGYVLSILDEKRICMRIDKDYVNMISGIVSQTYDKTMIHDTIVINVKDCHINLSIDWKELTDLIGMHLRVNATPRRYSYWRTKEVFDEDNHSRITSFKYKGVSFYAQNIKNITAADSDKAKRK
jgi:hypothetical protein